MPWDWFSVYAPIYDPFLKITRIAPSEALLALADLRTHERILDVGGGTGRIAAAAVGTVGEIVILDPCRAMLERGPRHPTIHRVRGGARQIPFGEATFDAILCVDALHHIKEAQSAVAEMHRVLKPGGRVIVQEFDVRGWRGKLAAIFEHLFIDHSRFIAPETLQDLFGSTGIPGTSRRHSWLEYTFLGRKAEP